MVKNISILGCGWLGLPLGKRLVKNGFNVKGSTTTHEKFLTLLQSRIDPYLINCSPQIERDKLDHFFSSEVLFLNIPFRRNLEDPRYYQDQITNVASYCERGSIKWVIFASSTSVYPDNIKNAVEDVDFTPANKRSKVLHEIENQLLNNKNFKSTIIRFAGLYGKDRKLGNFLAGKELKNGNSPVNLVHLDDCIEVVSTIIEHKAMGEIFNVVSDGHPQRRDLYTKAAKQSQQSAPIFLDDNISHSGKIVSNQKLKKMFHYKFLHPDPMLDV